jgi:hypothetical protein
MPLCRKCGKIFARSFRGSSETLCEKCFDKAKKWKRKKQTKNV